MKYIKVESCSECPYILTYFDVPNWRQYFKCKKLIKQGDCRKNNTLTGLFKRCPLNDCEGKKINILISKSSDKDIRLLREGHSFIGYGKINGFEYSIFKKKGYQLKNIKWK